MFYMVMKCTRENQPFQIAALSYQILYTVSVRYSYNILLYYRTLIQFIRNKMTGGPNDFYTPFIGLFVRIATYESWEKGMVDIDNASRVPAYKFRRQNLHISRQHDGVYIVRPQKFQLDRKSVV